MGISILSINQNGSLIYGQSYMLRNFERFLGQCYNDFDDTTERCQCHYN